MESKNTDLVQVGKATGLEENKVQILIDKFASSFSEAKELVKGARDIKVTDIEQVDEMSKARDLRLSLKNTRVSVDKTRKALKEQSLREGKAIDGMANIIKALIVPVEQYLQEQEDFALKLKAERNTRKEDERISKLSKYVEDVSVYTLHPENLSEDSFQKILETSRKAFEADQKAEAETEAKRIADQKAEKAEQERIREENEKLKKDAEAREKEVAKEKEEQEAKLTKEREAKEKLEAGIKAKEVEAEAEAKAIVEAEEEKKRLEMSAPDRQKLLDYGFKIDSTPTPTLSTPEAMTILNNFLDKLGKLTKELDTEATKLGKGK